jgi:hypothetical protein
MVMTCSLLDNGLHQFAERRNLFVVDFSSEIFVPARPLPAAASPDQPHDHEQQYGADGGSNDRGNNSSAKMKTEPGKQQTGDEGADDSNDNVANQTKACPLHDLAGQPARNSANQQYDEQTFSRHMHNGFLRLKRIAGGRLVWTTAPRERFGGGSVRLPREMGLGFDRNTQRALPSAAAPPIGGAVAAARAVPRGLIGVIARVGSHVVVATPEVRYAADTPNSHDVRVPGCGSEPQTRMDDTSFNRGGRERRKTEASGRGDDERELS